MMEARFVSALVGLLLAAAVRGTALMCPEPSFDFSYEIGVPDGCLSYPETCDYYLGIGINSNNNDYVDIQLEGTLSGGIGWIAVGFSLDQLMFNDDVQGCIKDANNEVFVIDTWNPAKHHQANERDPTQEGICTHESSYVDGRISCNFSRYFDVVNPGYDYNIRNRSYYLFLGRSTTGGPGNDSFTYHLPDHPLISDGQFNVYNSSNKTNGSVSPSSEINKRAYEQAHGVLMYLSFVLLAGTGIFFSSWMKPALATGLWFQIHRGLMVLSLLFAIVGFMIIFIGMRGNAPPGILGFECAKEAVHFAFGIILMAMFLFNPILALLRPKPDAKERIWFNVLHGYVFGYTIKILAFVNIGIGLVLFQSPHCGSVDIQGTTGDYILVYYILYLAFIVTWEIVLYAFFTYLTMKAPYSMRSAIAPSLLRPFFCHDNKGYEKLPDIQEPERPPVSQDYLFRWIGFGVFVTATVGMTLVNVGFLIADEKSINGTAA